MSDISNPTYRDLLPFGQIEERHTSDFVEREVIMNVLGFKETLAESREIAFDDVLTIHVPPLHGMVVLKLISWSDRPEIRLADLEDIYRIVKHYYDIAGDAVYAQLPPAKRSLQILLNHFFSWKV